MTCEVKQAPVRLGVIGLGRAFVLMLPAFRNDPRVRLVAACAPRAASRERFSDEFGGRGYATVEELCADPQVEAVYVATPHQMHRDHTIIAAGYGKHVMVDKPLAISLADGEEMVEACRKAGVHLIVGPSHSFDPCVTLARQLIASGEFGAVRMVQAFNYTDFLYRPRRPEELRTEDGGGVIFSQGAHQIDCVRLLVGKKVTDVIAHTGNWDPSRSTEGAYSALLSFEGGCFASLTYSGYGHFDSDEWMGWTGELGDRKEPDSGAARRALRGMSEDDEIAYKASRTYGGQTERKPAVNHEHFGPMIVSCERGDLRLMPDGVQVYGEAGSKFIAAPPLRYPRREIIDALAGALRHDEPPTQDGNWGLANLEICHAMLQSALTRQPVALRHQ